MTDSNLTAIQLVIDRSGSMEAIREDAEGAIGSFIRDQKAQPGKALLRVTTFDNYIETPLDLEDISGVQAFKLVPRGMTALFDAMGTSIVDLGMKLDALPEDEKPAHVIFVTITDGFENASREYDSEAVKKLLTKQQDEFNWTFMFLSAGEDAVLTGAKIGVRENMAMNYAPTGRGYGATMDSASYAASSVRSGIAYEGFTDEDRKKAGGKS